MDGFALLLDSSCSEPIKAISELPQLIRKHVDVFDDGEEIIINCIRLPHSYFLISFVNGYVAEVFSPLEQNGVTCAQ